MARELACSSAAVSGALRDLDGWGVSVIRIPGRGCRLAAPLDWLEAGQIRAHLGGSLERVEVRVADVVDSTNSVLLQHALAGVPSGLALLAEVQTAGRGRRGRSWHAGLGGGLTFSLLWRFEQGADALAGLSLAVSVALVRALRGLGVAEAQLKWPNDILWRHRKLAGVLTEIEGESLGPSAAVIGVGMNVRLDQTIRERIDQAVTDVVTAGGPADRNRLAGVALAHLAEMLHEFGAKGFAPFREEWESYHLLAAKSVAVTMPDGTEHTGLAAGVAQDGALLLQTTSGLRRFYSGEVSLRPLELPRQSGVA